MKRYINVKFTKEGLHQYTGSPDNVSYLRNMHRHLFYFNIKIEVFTNNRELEFIMFKHQCEDYIDERYLSQRYIYIDSCEMTAEYLISKIEETYPNRFISVEVSEDNENSSIVTNEGE